ncbi:1,6-anhydro-N-acetylmuramyl-L-alanine amidase AmpD [uncultured Parasutterella sp.]|uniref:1,6-anhydro-N-acetylmuramyl-L-alanine amidase AmpD n=1 Tax=uncultured Parasutterella sp. TaxID=1263098 RepID=UPI002594852E|nr:1,6-anhydro-N-acetylmuramyl-L-alanine amidase AmpD [uncultured Parasutterella sp.]
MKIDSDGWCDEACIRISPHFNERPQNEKISLIVIHNISLPRGKFGTGYVDALFQNTLDCEADPSFSDLEGLHVSSHFFIDRKGQLFQYVSCLDRAWHAGVSRFAGREGCNDFSIGIELEGTDDIVYTDEQYQMLALLTDTLADTYPITDITCHANIAPQRKTDPGASFDWIKFERLCKTGKLISYPFV